MRLCLVIPVLCAPLILTACDSPSMAFQAIEPVMITMDGSEFSVRVTPYDAEAIRLNFEPGATRYSIVPKGVKAIEAVSGCKVLRETLRGDADLVAADIACAGVAPRIKPKRPPRLDCTAYEVGGFGDHTDLEIDCLVVE